MKIGILYICTGKYSIFWKDFFETCELNFLPGSEKHYFVFTDDSRIAYADRYNVHTRYQKSLEWPFPTLLRFQMFVSVKEQLEEMDYIFFFNANMKFVSPIKAEEVLPDNKTHDGLVVVLHSGYYKATPDKLPFESKQRKSLAFMETGKNYFQGCFNGGTRQAYLKMIQELQKNVQQDLDNNIIAVWHDESHLNKYMSTRNPRILSPAFSYPEGQSLDMVPRILMLDKRRVGGHDYLRGQRPGIAKRIWSFFKKLKG